MTSEHTVGEVRAILARRRMSQTDLASRIKDTTGAEINSMWVNRRLTGQTTINVDDLDLIARALELDPRDLIEPFPEKPAPAKAAS